MSAKTLLDQIDDLSEDDIDFIPEPKTKRTTKRRRSSASSGSDSDSDSDADTEAEEHSAKKVKTQPVDAEERERKEVQLQADWKSILAVEEEAKREREQGLKTVEGEDLVEIRRPRFFAGETI